MGNQVPKRWQTFERLQQAGCPLDWDHLPRCSCPLDVVTIPSSISTNVFPMEDGTTGLALPLAIQTRALFVILKIELLAEWLVPSVSWISNCDKLGSQFYCFHGCVDGNRRFDSRYTLNWLCRRLTQLKGNCVESGFLLGKFCGSLPASAPSTLHATLWIHGLTYRYPFPVSIDNTPLIP
jgi:hypothetical protein